MITAIRLRPLRRDDLDQVVAIERRDGPGSWTSALFAAELDRPATRCYLVAEDPSGERGAVVLAYGGVMLVADEAHITTVAVASSARRRGVATDLLRALLDAAAGRGATAATLEVRASNTAARALYGRLGFVPEGVRPRYYADDGEDAIVMWRRGLEPVATGAASADAADARDT